MNLVESRTQHARGSGAYPLYYELEVVEDTSETSSDHFFIVVKFSEQSEVDVSAKKPSLSDWWAEARVEGRKDTRRSINLMIEQRGRKIREQAEQSETGDLNCNDWDMHQII